MTKVKMLFEFRGRVGDAVVYPLNGKMCMRRLPTRREPLCREMVEQQQRVKSVARLYRAMKCAGLSGAWELAEKPAGWSAYNLFLQRNLPALTGDGGIGDFRSLVVTEGGTINDERLEINDGSLIINDERLGINDGSLIINDERLRINDKTLIINDEGLTINDEGLGINDGRLVVGWSWEGGYAHCRGDDQLGAVLMKGEEKHFEMRALEVEGGLRKEGKAVVRVPEELRGWRYLYCYMKSVAGEYSRSVCVDLQG